MRRADLAEQDGWALVTALVLTMIALSVGLATMSLVNGQQHASRVEREREAAITLAEGALTDQMYMLSTSWPGTSQGAFTTGCTSAGTASAQCPDPAALARTYSGAAYAGGAWTTTVYDDSGPLTSYYSDALAQQAGVQRWDANGNGEMWVRASASVKGHTRTVVARVKAASQNELIPFATIVAGHFGTTNSGNKQIIDTLGNASQASSVLLRCSNITQLSCLNLGGVVPAPPLLPTGKAAVQLAPWTVVQGYTGGSFVSPAALGRLRATAKALGTYYANGCPSTPAGRVVFIENGDCSWTNLSGWINSPTQPGLLIVNRGTFNIGGGIIFWGAVYAANAQNSTGDVISTAGTASIEGTVAIDGSGGLMAGSSAMNFQYQTAVTAAVRSFGAVRIIQNTWRELT